MTARKWVFTTQVPADGGIPHIQWNPRKMAHLVYQLEKAPSTGQLHLQGYVHFTSAMRMAGVRKILGGNPHLEECANPERAIEYAKKEDTRVEGPWEHGAPTSQGQRTDLQSAVEMVIIGKRPREIAMEAPLLYARFHKNIQALRQELAPSRKRDNIKVVLLWGETRTGKTRSVYDRWNDEVVYRVFDQKTPWMDGYSDQQIALFDDYGEGMMNIHYLKNLLDRYPMDVPIKGGRTAWNPELIIMTSNLPLELWYPSAREEDLAALRARMQQFHFPSERDAALAWMQLNDPLKPAQQPPAQPLLQQPIDINSASDDDDDDTVEVSDDQDDVLSDLAAPSYEWNGMVDE